MWILFLKTPVPADIYNISTKINFGTKQLATVNVKQERDKTFIYAMQ
jgi:hypothetical protein